jgi:hypothetical protein
MKLLIGAAAAAFVLAASPAFAQASLTPNCTGFEAAPTLPDGATAERAAVETANTTFTTWNEATLAKLRACQADVAAMTAAFNAAEAARRAAQTGWEAEVVEFNARGGQPTARERRRDGGVMTGGRRD